MQNPFSFSKPTFTEQQVFNTSTAPAMNDLFQDFIFDPLNKAVGIDANTFKTGNAQVDSFLQKQADNAKSQATEMASNEANAVINSQLQKMTGNTSSSSQAVTAPATSGTETNIMDEVSKTEHLAALGGLALGTTITKFAADQGWGISLLAGLGLGLAGYFGAKELAKK